MSCNSCHALLPILFLFFLSFLGYSAQTQDSRGMSWSCRKLLKRPGWAWSLECQWDAPTPCSSSSVRLRLWVWYPGNTHTKKKWRPQRGSLEFQWPTTWVICTLFVYSHGQTFRPPLRKCTFFFWIEWLNQKLNWSQDIVILTSAYCSDFSFDHHALNMSIHSVLPSS